MREEFTLNQDLHLLNHPFYQAWTEGRLSVNDLKDYACQYYSHVAAFPGYLQNAIEISPNENAKSILEENLSEEIGAGGWDPHPELWLRFAEGTGVPRETVKSSVPRKAIQNVVDTFNGLSRSSYARALGAIYAYESQIPEVALAKIEGLKIHFGMTDARSLSFFEVHKLADIQHREALISLIKDLPAEQRAEAKLAADKAMRALWEFLTDVHSPELRA